MKKILLTTLVVLLAAWGMKIQAQSQDGNIPAHVQYKVITTIESIVPSGIGRSRIVEDKTPLDYEQYTTERTDGKKSRQGKVDRSDIKVDSFRETKLLNFYSMTGINFQNIASNDALITSMLNKMAANGWQLFKVVSGVESDAGRQDGKGIFITRYIFAKVEIGTGR